MHRLLALVGLLGLAGGCTAPIGADGAGAGDRGGKDDAPASPEGLGGLGGRAIADTRLEVDLTTLQATAHVAFEAGTASTARLELSHTLGGAVTATTGTAQIVGDALLLDGLPQDAAQVSVRYQIPIGGAYQVTNRDDVYDAGTYMWPTQCSALFPCHAQPADGTTFSLSLTGIPDGMTAIYPSTLPEVPSYQLAWAVGPYRYVSYGKTAAGTEVGFYVIHQDVTSEYEQSIGEALRRGFDFVEKTYGPYRFGTRVASVEVDTLPTFAGGQEHHPYWHIASSDFGVTETHIHEAVHGWFGDGVRIACWEDLLLSEGVTTYVTMRTRVAIGDIEEREAWGTLAYQSNSPLHGGVAAWPPGCTGTSSTFAPDGDPHDEVYSRGAQFLREVARQIGVDVLDGALADFYRDHGGKAARVDDLLAGIHASTGFDPTALAETWLRAVSTPVAQP